MRLANSRTRAQIIIMRVLEMSDDKTSQIKRV